MDVANFHVLLIDARLIDVPLADLTPTPQFSLLTLLTLCSASFLAHLVLRRIAIVTV